MWFLLAAHAAPDADPVPARPADARIEDAELSRADWSTRLSIPHAPERSCHRDSDCGLARMTCCGTYVAVRAELVEEASVALRDPTCDERRCRPRLAVSTRAVCLENQCTVDTRSPVAADPSLESEHPVASAQRDLDAEAATWRARLAVPDAPEAACRVASDCATARLACCGLPVAVNQSQARAADVAARSPLCRQASCAAPPAHHLDCVRGRCTVVLDGHVTGAP